LSQPVRDAVCPRRAGNRPGRRPRPVGVPGIGRGRRARHRRPHPRDSPCVHARAGGVLGHWSRPSSTPSPSASAGQPLELTRAPTGVPGTGRARRTPRRGRSQTGSRARPWWRRRACQGTHPVGRALRRGRVAGGPLRVKTDRPSEPTTWPPSLHRRIRVGCVEGTHLRRSAAWSPRKIRSPIAP